jgi:hypothetical protein
VSRCESDPPLPDLSEVERLRRENELLREDMRRSEAERQRLRREMTSCVTSATWPDAPSRARPPFLGPTLPSHMRVGRDASREPASAVGPDPGALAADVQRYDVSLKQNGAYAAHMAPARRSNIEFAVIPYGPCSIIGYSRDTENAD